MESTAAAMSDLKRLGDVSMAFSGIGVAAICENFRNIHANRDRFRYVALRTLALRVVVCRKWRGAMLVASQHRAAPVMLCANTTERS